MSDSVFGTAARPDMNGVGQAATRRSGSTLSGVARRHRPGAVRQGSFWSWSPATAGSATWLVKPSVNRMW